ncbi:hypothetical protein [Alkaliphilus pronyensis]|nr:hypothetical protein [Alkaliphilus pronyensis]
MKKTIVMLMLVCSFVLPGIKEIDAYREYGTDIIVYHNSLDTFAATDLRH